MNKRRIIIFFLSVITVTLLLTSCTDKALEATSAALTTPLPSHSQASPGPTAFVLPSGYTVKTDDSKLTPYQKPEEVYTRLSQSYMPELVPSKDYGMLLPYVGKVMFVDPENVFSTTEFNQYGLITQSGMIVTDAVFSSIYQPYHLTKNYTYENAPYYILNKMDQTVPGNSDSTSHRCAVSSLDGSWVTPFDYEDVICCDSVMLLIRDSSVNDFDVMDYDGHVLYNTKDLGCFSELNCYSFVCDDGPSPFDFGNGYIVLWSLDEDEDYSCAYMNELNGDFFMTDYSSIRPFIAGFAAVEKDGLWGYINTSFSETMIPAYLSASNFKDERAVVSLASGENAVIDTSGNILYTSKLSISYENGFYIVSDFAGKKTLILNKDFGEIPNSENVQSWGSIYSNSTVGLTYVNNNVTTVCFGDKMTSIPGAYTVNWITEDFLYCSNRANSERLLMTLDGKIIKDSWNRSKHISAFTARDKQTYFIENVDEGYVGNESVYSHSLLDATGNVLFSGKGYMQFKEENGYLEITSADYFAYMDTSGKYIFKKSLMDSIPD